MWVSRSLMSGGGVGRGYAVATETGVTLYFRLFPSNRLFRRRCLCGKCPRCHGLLLASAEHACCSHQNGKSLLYAGCHSPKQAGLGSEPTNTACFERKALGMDMLLQNKYERALRESF